MRAYRRSDLPRRRRHNRPPPGTRLGPNVRDEVTGGFVRLHKAVKTKDGCYVDPKNVDPEPR